MTQRFRPNVRFHEVRPFAGYVWRRFSDDQCMRMAASLSYTSLLAVVPLTAIAFSMLAAFPVFEGVRDQFQDMLFSNFLPQSADVMREYFDTFVRNTAGLTAVGIVGLALTAVLLLGTIESALNAIFRVVRPRATLPRFLVFWALITVGPLLIGASFSLSTYFFALTEWAGANTGDVAIGWFTQFIPTLIVMVAVGLFYLIIPNRPVSLASAIVGGFTAGMLFSILRRVFGYYVASFPTYQTIYGAVSAVPIFLIWMYLSWAVVLLGAALSASYDEWRGSGGQPSGGVLRSGARLSTALHFLAILLAGSRRGGAVPLARLLNETGCGEQAAKRLLDDLQSSGYAEKTAAGAWVLARDLDSATLHELFQALGLGLGPQDLGGLKGEGWSRRLHDIVVTSAEAQREVMAIKLRTLLAGDEPAPAGER